LAGALWRRKIFTLLRLIAILMIAAILAASVVGLFDWAQPLLPMAVLVLQRDFLEITLLSVLSMPGVGASPV
jgi:hypothetical protein